MKTTTDMMKALGDETRLRILVLLSQGELCVCEILAALELPQSTVSRHLAILRRASWVIDQRRGNWMYYRLVPGDTSREAILKGVLQQVGESEQAMKDQEGLRNCFANRETGSIC